MNKENIRIVDMATLHRVQAARRERLEREARHHERITRLKALASRHAAHLAMSCLTFVLLSGIGLLYVGRLHGWW